MQPGCLIRPRVQHPFCGAASKCFQKGLAKYPEISPIWMSVLSIGAVCCMSFHYFDQFLWQASTIWSSFHYRCPLVVSACWVCSHYHYVKQFVCEASTIWSSLLFRFPLFRLVFQQVFTVWSSFVSRFPLFRWVVITGFDYVVQFVY